MTRPEVECAARKRPLQRLNGFHCELQSMHAHGLDDLDGAHTGGGAV
jgi:hypothetical protein|nr:MAG TPA: hypothetical protein [Caudoviricetes sp.]